MSRVYNFSAGPAAIPLPVLEQIRAELLDWQHLGMSVMEISHRRPEFVALNEQTEQLFRELLNIPKHYQIIFLPGGATVQFAMVPLNLLGQQTQADYIDTGIWSRQAIEEAKKYCQVNVAASNQSSASHTIPDRSSWQLNPNAAYVHYTSNETITGVEFSWVPDVGDVPLVTDMSSDIMSRHIDISRFGLIYAAAQKNLGPAGYSVVIIREDLLNRASPLIPSVFNYQVQAEAHSLYNTPPTFSCYVLNLVLHWIKEQGGVQALAEVNQRKAKKLYQYIDTSQGFYTNKVAADYRSRMNVAFFLPNNELDSLFVEEANKAGLVNLKGHRRIGGIRASIYNAMPEAGVDALIEFMQDFHQRYG